MWILVKDRIGVLGEGGNRIIMKIVSIFSILMIILLAPVVLAGINYGSETLGNGSYGGIGILNVSHMSPSNDSVVTKHELFNFTTNVTCSDGSCGNVSAWLDPVVVESYQVSVNGLTYFELIILMLLALLCVGFYVVLVDNNTFRISSRVSMILAVSFVLFGVYYGINDGVITGLASSTLISTTAGATPFYTISTNPINCGVMNSTDGCNTTFTVNATGTPGLTYVFFVIYNSTTAGVSHVNSSSVNINITVAGLVAAFRNASINFTANQTITINATVLADTLIEIITGSNVSNASVIIVQYSENQQTATASGVTALSKYIEIEVDNGTNNNISTASLRIYYTDAEVSSAGVEESTLRMYKWNTSSSSWYVLNDTGVDTINNYVWANVSNFSNFGVFGSATSSSSTTATSSGGGGSSIVVLKGDKFDVDFEKNSKQSLILGPRDIVEFVLDGQSYAMSVSRIFDSSVRFSSGSESLVLYIVEGITQLIDVNNDGNPNMKITLDQSISKTQIKITLETFRLASSESVLDEISEDLEIMLEESNNTIGEIPVVEKPYEVDENKFNVDYLVTGSIFIAILVIGFALLYKPQPPRRIKRKKKSK